MEKPNNKHKAFKELTELMKQTLRTIKEIDYWLEIELSLLEQYENQLRSGDETKWLLLTENCIIHSKTKSLIESERLRQLSLKRKIYIDYLKEK